MAADVIGNTDNNPQAGVGGTSYIYDFGTSPNTRTAVSQKARILTPHYGDTQAMHQVGVLSEFGPNSSRTIDEVRGIGFGDKIAELVPGITTAAKSAFNRALLYLCNMWQATGYAAGVDGPVRSLAHHRWPFDVEMQMVFSSLADWDLVGRDQANIGFDGKPGEFNGGVKRVTYGQVTPDMARGGGNPGANRGHSAIITICEACWFDSWSIAFTKDQGQVLESGNITITDMHDYASMYGEFMASGNDPTIGQLGSIRFAKGGAPVYGVGGTVAAGATQRFTA
ncbi:MAG: hypothetical protein WC824_05730 [Bacteroidota bacterium]|jgi:hypothetical protein